MLHRFQMLVTFLDDLLDKISGRATTFGNIAESKKNEPEIGEKIQKFRRKFF